jgi:hypothetical protein
MVNEKELISKLEELRGIKPDKDWAFSLKSKILAEGLANENQASFSFFTYFKPAFATLVSVFIIMFGVVGLAQNSMPGDFLYSVKKLTEKSQTFFVSEENKSQLSLNLLNKRLEELIKVAEANQAKNLSSAINEVQASIPEATRNLAKNPDTKEIKDIISQIEDKVQAISVLGVDIGDEEIQEWQNFKTKRTVEYLISDLETRTLTEEQEDILSRMKELVQEEKYQEATDIFFLEFDRPTGEEVEL